MRTFFKSPLVRISFGLAMLTVSMLLVTDLLGLVPDTKKAELQSRKVIAESLAVQLSTKITDEQVHSVEETLRSVVERNDRVLSAALRMISGDLLVEFGNHSENWKLTPGDRSTASLVQVPLYDKKERWGNLELRFAKLVQSRNLFSDRNSFFAVILFMGLAGFLAYWLFLKRTMRELNPDAVVPERVRNALDALAEGLLIVDKDGYIVFSNSVFADKIGVMPNDLVGKDSSGFEWENDSTSPDCIKLPWLCTLEGKDLSGGNTIRLRTELDQVYTFNINASPITAVSGKIRGAMVTFDDVTELEIKNEELSRTLHKLEHSQDEITRQNKELQVLATRDPLTGALNRRSLFQGFETLFAEARQEGEELSCIMLDIDHFKSVNDQYGHAVGDEVIKTLAGILAEHSRSNDLVGRYGGEEFCVVLPGVSAEVCAQIAERMRLAIEKGNGTRLSDELQITSSFGVSSLSSGASSYSELVEQADFALYEAKQSGRNRVVCWSGSGEDGSVNNLMMSLDTERLVPIREQEAGSENVGDRALSQSQRVIDHTQDQAEKVHQRTVQNASPRQSVRALEHKQQLESVSSNVISLSNQILLFDRIDQAIKRAQRYETNVAVLAVNIDALQRVNDTLGLTVGEKLARTIVSRIKQILRSTDTVTLTRQDELAFSISRLGSNEIVVLLTDLEEAEIITSILQRVFAAYDEPVEVEGNEYYFNADVGVSVFPFDGGDSDTLLKNASSAMHEAMQSQGRNNIQFFANDINERSQKLIRMEAELHRALERNELLVYYQPKVDLRTGTILGMEALLRWQHPQLGIVPPSEFIPLAEQTGLIEEMGQWVVRTVCRQIKLWQDAGYDAITVAVNLSPVQFRNPGLADQIMSLIDEAEIPASALEVEITEGVFMQDIDAAVTILEKLSKAGLSISLDDFGTEYSSLRYLKRFPLDKIKIDQSFITDFVRDTNDAAIVSAIIAMSHSLGLQVVAEGVETEEQLRFLQDLQCDEMQGYLISKPVPRDEAGRLLAESSGVRRMIMKGCMVNSPMGHEGGPLVATGMIGVLNDFPMPHTEQQEQRSSKSVAN